VNITTQPPRNERKPQAKAKKNLAARALAACYVLPQYMRRHRVANRANYTTDNTKRRSMTNKQILN